MPNPIYSIPVIRGMPNVNGMTFCKFFFRIQTSFMDAQIRDGGEREEHPGRLPLLPPETSFPRPGELQGFPGSWVESKCCTFFSSLSASQMRVKSEVVHTMFIFLIQSSLYVLCLFFFSHVCCFLFSYLHLSLSLSRFFFLLFSLLDFFLLLQPLFQQLPFQHLHHHRRVLIVIISSSSSFFILLDVTRGQLALVRPASGPRRRTVARLRDWREHHQHPEPSAKFHVGLNPLVAHVWQHWSPLNTKFPASKSSRSPRMATLVTLPSPSRYEHKSNESA